MADERDDSGAAILERAGVRAVRAALRAAGITDEVRVLGHPAPVRTLVDEDLAAYDVIWAAAGHHQTVFPTTFAQLVAATGGAVVAVD